MAIIPQDDNRITYFGETDSRNKRVRFGIKAKDRTRHMYVIGKTGMGKSTLLENMAAQDIQGGEGMCFIDPHGKTADLLLEYVPKERIRDVIYIAPFDTEYPISFNVLEAVNRDKRHLVVSGLMSTFKKIWVDAWSARMEYILTNTLLALLESPGSTLLGVNRMLSDKDYRKEVVSHVTDVSVKTFWTKEFANYTERQAAEAVPAIQNKVGQFTANPLIRNMIGQPNSSFDFRKAMDERKIIIINLSKGKIGDENMKLLGGLLVTKIYLAAMSRADVSDRVIKMLPNFYLHVDEFQNFANASFADILSEARKYKLNLTMAHQYIEQMDEMVRPAVFGNVGTMIVFRVGATDAEALEKEFAPQFEIEDLVNLGFTQIYLKLMIDGLTSAPFSAVTLPPIPHPETSYVQEIVAASREQFALPREKVEEEIVRFHDPIKPVAAKPASSGLGEGQGAANGSVPSKPVTAASRPTAPAVSDYRHAPQVAIQPTVSPGAPLPVPESPVAKPAAASVSTPVTSKPAPSPIQPLRTASVPAKDPVVHQPFKAAIEQALKSAAPTPKPAPAIQTPAPTASVAPIAPAAPKAPTVSLSALATKQPPKRDPKSQSPENVSELKNALAAILKKDQSQLQSLQGMKPIPAMTNNAHAERSNKPVVSAPIAPVVKPAAPVASTPAPPVPPQTPSTDTGPNEVSEEVLQNVLKVE